MAEQPPAAQQPAADAQVMQGDIVRSTLRSDRWLGWVCCITPESDEGHVYWQPHDESAASDSREPLRSLRCVDRALIPGDIVRRCDVTAGDDLDRGGRDRDAMGMVVSTEVMLDLVQLQGPDRQVVQGVPASSLRHLVPIRLVSWVVHRTDGWLGRVQSWDEDLVVCFAATGAEDPCRCRVRAANTKQGITIAESFYRDFFPGLAVSINVQDLRSGALVSEWLEGDAARATAAPRAGAEGEAAGPPPQRVEAVIEEVRVGSAHVEWLTQVPLRRGWSTERPPRSEECQEENLLFLLGEAECSSRWALGDRLRLEGTLCEVCRVETRVNLRWQDDVASAQVPARELQLCNPDAFSFFPSELVCQRTLEKPTGSALPGRCSTPSGASNAASSQAAPRTPGGGAEPLADRGGLAAPPSRGGEAAAQGPPGEVAAERPRGPVPTGAHGRDEAPPRAGFVVRADPASRMVSVRWLDEGGPSPEEEWSAFDLQIDPELGYRLGDAVIRCRDWEDAAPPSSRGEGGAAGGAESGPPCAPRVGQVVALDAGTVRVRWLDGVVSPHAPRELYRVGDEDEGSIAGSHDGTQEGGQDAEGSAPGAPCSRDASLPPTAGTVDTRATATAGGDRAEEGALPEREDGTAAMDVDSTPASQPAMDVTPDADAPAPAAGGAAGTSGSSEAAAPAPAPQPEGPGPSAVPATRLGSMPVAEEPGAEEPGELSFEDMAWEPLPQDHHFVHSPPHPAGPSCRQFMRRVQREWEILRRGLPRSIWVHVYPDRTELLRACLIGPEGTPYSDALFFFDVHLPAAYPQVPPQVKFWSFGENLNPNLYENGKVCLSLLGTWTGRDSETWSPERSNLLQVLVSILGLVLNTEPYYNEPGFERERDTPQGDLRSQRYNESVALSSYHLMLSVLHTPPGDFSRPVRRHFAERRAVILDRAKRLQSGEEAHCSEGFRRSLAALLPRLGAALPGAPPPPSPPRRAGAGGEAEG